MPLQRVIATGAVVGGLTQKAAEKLGLNPGIPVSHGAYDSVGGCFGGVVYEPSEAILASIGTSVALYAVPPAETTDLGVWPLRAHVLPDGHLVTTGGSQAGTRSITHLHKHLRLTCAAAAQDSGLEVLVAKAENKLPPTFLCLPFGGVPLRAPLPGVKLPTIVSASEIVPSTLSTLVGMRRGIACFIRYAIDDLRACGLQISRIHIIGGGTKSKSFCSLLANMTDLPVWSFGAHAAAKGAAVLCVSHLQQRESLLRQVRRTGVLFEPSTKRRAFYDSSYDLFVRLLKAQLGGNEQIA